MKKLFRATLILMLGIILFQPGRSLAQKKNDLDVLTNNWMQYSDAPNELYHLLGDRAYPLLKQRADAIAQIHTLKQLQDRQKQIRLTLNRIIGPFPVRQSLNARIVRTEQKDGYRIENIIYESQPHFYVTSSLFIPSDFKGKKQLPAVIYCSGHSDNGYRNNLYLKVALNLVKKGFVVFSFDPIGQGERLGYYDTVKKKSMFPWPSNEHSYPGAQAFVAGSSLAKYMIWDGIRAVDYLLTRKEVDPQNIGITGRSGGGTQSAFIAAMDDRIKAAAPENFITNFTRLIQSVGPQDAEQNFYTGIASGIDHADLLIVRAPKPTLMITTTRDMFSIQGGIESANEVSRIYQVCGQPQNFKRAEDDAPHASTLKNREAMYAFFQHYLNNSGSSKDEETDHLTEEEVTVTQTGQVATSFKDAETVFSLNKKDALKLDEHLDEERRSPEKFIPAMLKQAEKLSGYLKPAGHELPVFAGRIQRDGYAIEKYFVKSSGGNYVVPYLLFRPVNTNHKALLYLHPSGKLTEAQPGGQIEWLTKQGFTVLAPDMVGTGETGPGIFQGDSYIQGVSYNIWFSAILTGNSLVGIRAADISSLTTLLTNVYHFTEVDAIAEQEMAPVLLHAAAFNSQIKNIALIKPYSSYRSLVEGRFYKPEFIHSAVADALKAYDLPDLAASLAPRKLLIYGVTDANGVEGNDEGVKKDIAIISSGYHYRKATQEFQITSSETDMKSCLTKWIGSIKGSQPINEKSQPKTAKQLLWD